MRFGYIDKEILTTIKDKFVKPEQGALIFGRNNNYTDIFFLKNKAKKKNINFNIGMLDRLKAIYKMIKNGYNCWSFIHSHDKYPFPSKTDIESFSVGSFVGIISIKHKVIIFYEIIKSGKKKSYKTRSMYIR